MAAAGLITQWIAIATGRDFLFGLIPAFDPEGSRNLQAWFVSAALATCAGLAALAAASARPDSAIQPRGWLAVVTVCLVWSAQRLTAVAGLWRWADHPFIRPELLMVAAGVLTCAAVVFSANAATRARLLGVMVAMLLFIVGEAMVAAADAGNFVSPLARAGALQFSRLIEGVAAGIFVLTVLRYLRAEHAAVSVIFFDSPRRGRRRAPASARGEEMTPAAVVRGLTMAVLLVLATSLTVALASHPDEGGWWHRLLFVDFEGNLPTWFSVLLLLTCSVPAATIAALARQSGDPGWRMWALLAVLFVLLSADEGASLHELLVTPLRRMVGDSPLLRYPLIIPGLAAVLSGALVFGRFLQAWPLAIRRLFLAGGGLFLVGALGVETVGGWFDPVLHGPSVTYLLLATLEEGCEMIGATLMLRALLGHLARETGVLRVGDAAASGDEAAAAAART